MSWVKRHKQISSVMLKFSEGTVHVKQMVLILTASYWTFCLSEFYRRWKCESSGTAHHTHQHVGGAFSSHHSVSTDKHAHTQILMTYFSVCKIMPQSDVGYVILLFEITELLTHTVGKSFWKQCWHWCLCVADTVLCVYYSVHSGMVQYAAILQRLFSQTLSAWTPPYEASLGQQRAYR